METAYSVPVALYSTDLDQSVHFYFRIGYRTPDNRNLSAFLSVVRNLDVRVLFPLHYPQCFALLSFE